jgi:hypothetical protein
MLIDRLIAQPTEIEVQDVRQRLCVPVGSRRLPVLLGFKRRVIHLPSGCQPPSMISMAPGIVLR